MRQKTLDSAYALNGDAKLLLLSEPVEQRETQGLRSALPQGSRRGG